MCGVKSIRLMELIIIYIIFSPSSVASSNSLWGYIYKYTKIMSVPRIRTLEDLNKQVRV